VQHFPQTDGTATLTSVFSGVTAAGTWDLWMIDNFGDPVTVNGWKLILTVNALEVGTTTTVSSSLQPAYTAGPNNSVTFTATVTSGGNPVTAGTVAFYANGSSSPHRLWWGQSNPEQQRPSYLRDDSDRGVHVAVHIGDPACVAHCLPGQ
jgi:hypothetical protein